MEEEVFPIKKRTCSNCWWVCQGSCKFSLELRQIQPNYKMSDTVCWGWRPELTDEKMKYLERYGREIERIGVIPSM